MSGTLIDPGEIEMFGFSRFQAFLDVNCGNLKVLVAGGSTFDTEARVTVVDNLVLSAGFVQVGGARRCQLIKTSTGTVQTN